MLFVPRPGWAQAVGGLVASITRSSRGSVQEERLTTPVSPRSVVLEAQPTQVGEAAQRYLPAQVVAGEVQHYQVGEAAQLRRYLPAQGGEVQKYQVGEAESPTPPDLPAKSLPGGAASRLERLPNQYLPAQLVVDEIQLYQVGEAAQLRRYLPAQLVAVEAQLCGEAAQASPRSSRCV